MLFVRQAPCPWRTKHEEMRGLQVCDLLLKGLPAGALEEEERRAQNYVQKDPGAQTQSGVKPSFVVWFTSTPCLASSIDTTSVWPS